MFGQYFYNEIIRKTIISFGTLFNDIHIKHKDSNDGTISDMKVDLAYGSVQKFLARLEQQEDLNKPIQITLPRMSFEFNSINYDSERNAPLVQTFKALEGSQIKKVSVPVPYNLGFELNIISKTADDGFQILEQILPYFRNTLNLSIRYIESINEVIDVPLVLNTVNFDDDYEGDFTSRRIIIWTLQFTAKVNFYGPIADNNDGLIRKVQVDFYSNTDLLNSTRELRYTVVPDPLNASPDSNYGFKEMWEDFNDSKSYSSVQQKDV